MRARFVVLCVMSLTFGAGALASAAGDKKPAKTKVARHASKFVDAVSRGNAKFVSRDFPGAVAIYREAIQADPSNPLGHYLLGEAQSALGNLTEAEASWTQAENVGDKDPGIKTKALFCLADLKERQKKWDDAKAAWTKYKDYVSAHADAGGAPASADARIQAIETAQKQDKAYEIVRQRIADEKKNGAGKK
jgi:tetratricopeptide (TPR) repeat protein